MPTVGVRGRKTERRSVRSLCLVAFLAFPLGLIVGLHVASVEFLRVGLLRGAPNRGDDGAKALLEDGFEERPASFVPARKPIRPGLPKVPTGPMDETYVRHLYSTIKFDQVYDSHDQTPVFLNVSITDALIQGKGISEVQNSWKAKAKRFRRYLTEIGLSSVDAVSEEERGPWFTNLDMTAVRAAAINGASVKNCPCALRSRPVLDMAIVIPMDMDKALMSWALLESFRQLTVFPREMVFVIGNAGKHRPPELQAFLGMLRDFYVPDFPEMTRVKAYSTQSKSKPGDSRWFGFNQTTADIVTLFDNDDYMHPQFFHIFWRIFEQRPELDFALMLYEGGAVDGKCEADMFFPVIREFLERRQFSEQEIHRGASYPMSKYEELWGLIPTFDKKWWLGNTDAEPNWGIEGQHWWDMGCHNGWSTFRRYVMEMIPPPVDKFGGEDAIWNFRIGRSKFNYRCIELVMGSFLKSFCKG